MKFHFHAPFHHQLIVGDPNGEHEIFHGGDDVELDDNAGDARLVPVDGELETVTEDSSEGLSTPTSPEPDNPLPGDSK